MENTRSLPMNSCLAHIEEEIENGLITSRIGALNYALGYYRDEENIPVELCITILDKYLFLD